MTNQEILKIALEQSALDCNCSPEDFLSEEHVITESKKCEKARVYLPLPLECDLVSYGNNIVAQVSERLRDTVSSYIHTYSTAHCFETPNLQVLNEELKKFHMGVCFMAEYFLPDMTKLEKQSCPYELKVLHPKDFAGLYKPQWSNALCDRIKDKDVIGVGAYDKGTLIGFAGASADCETMYQIGIDVLPSYRKKGVASCLTTALSFEILNLGKVPFYCAAWSNIPSVRNAIKSGFRPAWVELSARNLQVIEKMNQEEG